MAKENSFDIVSQVDMQEVDNAFQQTRKELTQRYDLKDSGAKVELDKQKHEMTVEAPSDFVAGQVIDIISSKLVKRGIDKDTLTKINKDLKALKLKIKTQIEGDKIRVSSQSRDTLQDVIAHLKAADFGQPLQFVNYR